MRACVSETNLARLLLTLLPDGVDDVVRAQVEVLHGRNLTGQIKFAVCVCACVLTVTVRRRQGAPVTTSPTPG